MAKKTSKNQNIDNKPTLCYYKDMTTHHIPQELATSAEPKSKVPAVLLAAGTALVAIGLLAPQVPQSRALMPDQVKAVSDEAYSRVIGSIVQPMITQDKQ